MIFYPTYIESLKKRSCKRMENLQQAWNAVLDYMRANLSLSETSINTWLADIQPISIEKDRIVALVGNKFIGDMVKLHFMDHVKTAIANVFGVPLELELHVKQREKPYPEPIFPDMDSIASGNLINSAANYEYSFENFIVGSSNKYAHAAAMAVAKNPAGRYNPLFIYGGSGLGKTHLMYAICNDVRERNPEMRILYAKGEDMTNEFIESLQNHTTVEFRAKYRQVDMLMVDDIQFLAGKTSMQEEFFHTLETLLRANKQIVLTSDRPPKEIATLEERLRSRFEMGLLADVIPPDLETRIAIVKRKAQLFDIEIDNNVATYIAEQLKNNVRQLEGAIKRIQAQADITGEHITINTAKAAIRDIQSDNPPVGVTIDRIITEVARTMNVTPEDIASGNRSAPVAQARHVAIYAVRSITGMSMNAIGEHFGGRDHSTILNSIKAAEKAMSKDPVFKGQVQDIIKNVSEL